MTMEIDEAICHAEEVAEENYGKATEYQYQCNELSKCLKCGDEHMQLAEWLKDYKRLKEQEPCEDAISRQAVDTLVDELARAISDERCCISRGRSTATIMQDILDLPSVKPQEKTGHWISFGVQGEMDGGQIVQAFTCSECGTISIFRMRSGNIVNGDICPNCGAKMEVENNG